MRDSISRALIWMLRLLLPANGRHAAKHPAAPFVPPPASPWSRPWTAPSSADVRAIFKNERTRELPEPQRERVWAVEFAALGIDYDFPTAPLGSLVTRERAAA
ncbi:hypothetical protein ACIRPS_30840 [Streptomyces griseoviridis]